MYVVAPHGPATQRLVGSGKAPEDKRGKNMMVFSQMRLVQLAQQRCWQWCRGPTVEGAEGRSLNPRPDYSSQGIPREYLQMEMPCGQGSGVVMPKGQDELWRGKH